MNKNNVIVSDNPFKNLTRTDIDLYYILVNLQKRHELETSLLSEDPYFVVTNEQLSKTLKRNVFTVSRCVNKLISEDFIKVKYIPDKSGLIRKVYVNP